MKLKFLNGAHLGCIKAIAASGNWFATGGTDEAIKLFDLVKNREVGSLFLHQDEITCLGFHNDDHLLSGDKTGKLCIWRAKDWQLVRELKGHNDGINSISVHPSGKLALTCSRDRTMRVWNLSNARAAYSQQLSYEAELVCWSMSGDFYAISSRHKVYVYDTKSGDLIYSYTQPKYDAIHSIAFVKEDEIASGGEDRKITVWNTKTGSIKATLEGFGNRVKGLAISPKQNYPATDYQNFLISISSDHTVKVWDLDKPKFPVVQTTVDARLTCIAIGTPHLHKAQTQTEEVNSPTVEEVKQPQAQPQSQPQAQPQSQPPKKKNKKKRNSDKVEKDPQTTQTQAQPQAQAQPQVQTQPQVQAQPQPQSQPPKKNKRKRNSDKGKKDPQTTQTQAQPEGQAQPQPQSQPPKKNKRKRNSDKGKKDPQTTQTQAQPQAQAQPQPQSQPQTQAPAPAQQQTKTKNKRQKKK
eukprot:TRINITY_DN302_c0_g2_i1.p1 TRINITY_DN302_c0_g2~~TRINITY_DN302_c0_g2_i1.p1  ORF type:complete len:513 (+),score=150.58 TRINITY_DN302_c0_g2_i1:143-1540(+)